MTLLSIFLLGVLVNPRLLQLAECLDSLNKIFEIMKLELVQNKLHLEEEKSCHEEERILNQE